MHPESIFDEPPASGLRPSNGGPAPAEPYRLTPSEFPAGQIIAGKYRVERWVGEGAMGVVLGATHLGLDETVAIKLIRPDAQRSTEMLSRFAKEAKIAARIRSEHVPRVLDVGVSEPFGPYIVMEYLEGRSLAELLELESKLEVRRAVEYVLQACEALAAAHAIGVIHRDIKPGNLFITKHGQLEVVKLLDFGISKAALTGRVFGNDLALNETGHVMGTPMYMSPEQIRSAPDIDSRTDIWSLGAVIYELVTGKTAFIAESMTEICAQILEGPVPQLQALDQQGKTLQDVINRCLTRDRAERFQTVADVAAALLPLASDSARLYADRSSCILRASSLDLTRASRSLASEELAAPSQLASRKPNRALRTAGLLAGVLAATGLAMFSAPTVGAPSSELGSRSELGEPTHRPEPELAQRSLVALEAESLTYRAEPPTVNGAALTPASLEESRPPAPALSTAALSTAALSTAALSTPAVSAERRARARETTASRMRLVQRPSRMRLVGLSEEKQ
jgi:eukaryotic-like serine/threonine-protein kinase